MTRLFSSITTVFKIFVLGQKGFNPDYNVNTIKLRMPSDVFDKC
jgi:hypothetical protein